MNQPKRLFVIALLVILALNIPALPSAAQDATTPPLSEKGPYGVDLVQMTFVDDSREGRELETLIWYPAEAGKSSYWMPDYQAQPDWSTVCIPWCFIPTICIRTPGVILVLPRIWPLMGLSPCRSGIRTPNPRGPT